MMLREKVLNRLRIENIPINEKLPPVVAVSIRNPKDVAIRGNILGVFLAISEDITSIPFFKDLLKEQGIYDELSKNEKSLFEKKEISKQDEINLSWSQESLYAISWCLGIVQSMSFPTTEADLNYAFQFLPPKVDLQEFIEKSSLIKSIKLLEELEFYYGLHWAKRHPESWNWFSKLKQKKLSISIIRERRKVLEWVVNSSLEWDDISLDT